MALKDDSDAGLMARFAGGEAAAFDLLYHRHESRVWRYLLRHTGNRALADDLMQEVWFGVARDAARYKPAARFTTWLFTLAHNRMIDSVRARRPSVSLDEDLQLAAKADSEPLAAALAQDQLAAVVAALNDLPADQREVFLLQIDGDVSVEEIAAITGTNFETAKSRLRYARAKLRELLKEHA